MKKAGCVTAFAANNWSSREGFQHSHRKSPSRRENTRGSEGAKAKGQLLAFVLGQCSLLRFVPDQGFVWFMKGKEFFVGIRGHDACIILARPP